MTDRGVSFQFTLIRKDFKNMEIIKILPKGFGANSYILTADGKNAVVIDPTSERVYNECVRRKIIPLP